MQEVGVIMDKEQLLEIEEEMKVYDSNYKTKVVTPGSVIDVFMEFHKGDKEKYDQFVYVCKEGEKEVPANSNVRSSLSYETYDKYFRNSITDEKIEIGDVTFSINKIFANIDEYNDFLDSKIYVGPYSVVDVTHNGHNKTYYFIEPTDNHEVQEGLDVVETNTPLYAALNNRNKGQEVNFAVNVQNQNEVVINRVYKDLNDYNLKNGLFVVKNNAVVDVVIDNIPFTFYISDSEEENLEIVSLDTPLGKALMNKQAGEKFVFNVRGKELNGIVNRVYNTKEEYERKNNTTKTL